MIKMKKLKNIEISCVVNHGTYELEILRLEKMSKYKPLLLSIKNTFFPVKLIEQLEKYIKIHTIYIY